MNTGGMMRREPQRRGVRQYNRSDVPHIRWTEELHARFVDAVHCLGGHDSKFSEATPKRILQLMNVKGVSISHIKSHLQMYRNMSNQVGFHSFLSTRATHRKKKTNSNDINSSGCDQPHSVNANLSNEWIVPRTSLEETSKEWEPNSDVQCFYNDNRQTDQNPNTEMDPPYARPINDVDSSCELTLYTYPTYQLLEETREGESIVHIDIDDVNRNKSNKDHEAHNHRFGGCIDLELTIS